jgi:hypothetical protein
MNALPIITLITFQSSVYNGLDANSSESQRQVEDRESRSYRAGAAVSLPLTWIQEPGRYRAARSTLE